MADDLKVPYVLRLLYGRIDTLTREIAISKDEAAQCRASAESYEEQAATKERDLAACQKAITQIQVAEEAHP